MNRILLFFALSSLAIVRKPAPSLQYSDLTGEWKLIQVSHLDNTDFSTLPAPMSWLIPSTLIFHPDSTVETQDIYWGQTLLANGNALVTFYGLATPYRITQPDSLNFFDPTNSTWRRDTRIHRLTTDSLVLHASHMAGTYKRITYLADTMPAFDAIVVSSSGCYGSCPVSNIILKSDGSVVFFGERYTSANGFFTAAISKERYLRLQRNFQKADIKNINTDFRTDSPNDKRITCTFIKDGKIYKSISDYGERGPGDFVWAYTHLLFMPGSLKFQRMDPAELPFYRELHYFCFIQGKKICPLSQSESFLLWDYLRQGTIVNQRATRQFKLGFERNHTFGTPVWESEAELKEKPVSQQRVTSIETDGRLYTFFMKGQPPVTIDIGFNFFDRNFTTASFKARE